MNWTIAWFNCYRLSYKKHKANQFDYKCRRHHMDFDQTDCTTETAKITKKIAIGGTINRKELWNSKKNCLPQHFPHRSNTNSAWWAQTSVVCSWLVWSVFCFVNAWSSNHFCIRRTNAPSYLCCYSILMLLSSSWSSLIGCALNLYM